MRLLLACLIFACGSALAGELFQPYTPPSLTAEQMNQRDWWFKQPGFKSITIVKVDSAALKSPVISVTLNGKTYLIKGERSRDEGAVIGDRTGGFRWAGQSADASGSLLYSDQGHLAGHFTLGGQYYTVAGSDGMCMASKGLCFLVEMEISWSEPGGPSRALFRPIPSVLSAEQVSAQEDYYKATNFKTIETIQIDRAVLNLDPLKIALTVSGKSYRLTGVGLLGFDRATTDPGRKLRHANWLNESTDDHGRVDVSADGRIVGDFTLGGWTYRVMSGEGVDFLLRSDKPALAPPQLFQPIVPAPALTASQAKAQEYWANLPEVIGITPVKVDSTALRSNVVVMILGGKPRHFGGNWKRTEPYPFNARTQMTTGTTSWSGFSSEGSGNLYFRDNGSVSGDFTIMSGPGHGYYKLMGDRDGALLIEDKPFRKLSRD